MTNKEAITILNMVEAHGSLVKQVKDRAIKALEQESKTGHWIDDTRLGYHVSICSNCNWRGHGDTCLIYKTNYCPNCGADMRGDENEAEIL